MQKFDPSHNRMQQSTERNWIRFCRGYRKILSNWSWGEVTEHFNSRTKEYSILLTNCVANHNDWNNPNMPSNMKRRGMYTSLTWYQILISDKLQIYLELGMWPSLGTSIRSQGIWSLMNSVRMSRTIHWIRGISLVSRVWMIRLWAASDSAWQKIMATVFLWEGGQKTFLRFCLSTWIWRQLFIEEERRTHTCWLDGRTTYL